MDKLANQLSNKLPNNINQQQPSTIVVNQQQGHDNKENITTSTSNWETNKEMFKLNLFERCSCTATTFPGCWLGGLRDQCSDADTLKKALRSWSREDLNVRVFQGVRTGGPRARQVCCRETFDMESGALLAREYLKTQKGTVSSPHPWPPWLFAGEGKDFVCPECLLVFGDWARAGVYPGGGGAVSGACLCFTQRPSSSGPRPGGGCVSTCSYTRCAIARERGSDRKWGRSNCSWTITWSCVARKVKGQNLWQRGRTGVHGGRRPRHHVRCQFCDSCISGFPDRRWGNAYLWGVNGSAGLAERWVDLWPLGEDWRSTGGQGVATHETRRWLWNRKG